MTAQVDYYFTLISPFSYLGHKALLGVAERHAVTIAFKPIDLMTVWSNSDAVPPAKRAEVRKINRLVELQRWRDSRGVPLTLHPAHWPTDPSLANGCVQAIVNAGKDPSQFMAKAYAACWSDDKDIAEEAVVAELLKASDFDADLMIGEAKTEAIKAQIIQNSQDAIADNIVGAPGYVLNGEPYWGQDRIEQLEDAIVSGRKPYTAG